MSSLSDQTYLLTRQYQSGERLNARIELHRRFSTNRVNWFRWVFDHLAAPTPAQVLELGSGTGLLWRDNADRLPAEWEITLSDLSPGMLAEAQRNLAAVTHPFAWAVIDAQSIPLPSASLDLVIANHMLYHVPDRNRALAEIRRVLRPGGRLYAAANGRSHLQEIRAMADRFGLADGMWDGRPERTFGLESGVPQLKQYFDQVSVDRFPNSLAVTEAEPLIAYMISMVATEVSGDRVQELDSWLREELAASHVVKITTEGGLLVAR